MSSLDGEDPHSKRPADTKFKQQRLPAWKPVLIPRNVLPLVLLLGVVILAVGIALLVGSNGVKEHIFDYTNCQNTGTDMPGVSCGDLLDNFSNGFTNLSLPDVRCTCELDVQFDVGFNNDDVYIYYALENFYQNHRAYVSSRWDAQLRAVTTKASADCDPLATKDGQTYAPCGLVANSLFNDTIRLYRCTNGDCSTNERVGLNGRHISWRSDRNVKFRNPTPPGDDLCQAPGFVDGLTPPSWPVPACQLGTNTTVYHAQDPEYGSNGVGYENEDLIVWMRTAALPDFRKLYRFVNGDESLPDGQYRIAIDYNYPVTGFGGTKKVVISTMSWQGGKNPFLGVCYIVVGCLCIACVAIFAVLIRVRGRELGSMQHLHW